MKDRQTRLQALEAEIATLQSEYDSLKAHKETAEEPEKQAKDAFDKQWEGKARERVCCGDPGLLMAKLFLSRRRVVDAMCCFCSHALPATKEQRKEQAQRDTFATLDKDGDERLTAADLIQFSALDADEDGKVGESG
jgi:uncharacterized protein YPO0396